MVLKVAGGLAGWMQAPLVVLASQLVVVLHNPTVVPAGNTSAGPGTNASNVTSLGPLGALTLAVEIVRCATP